MISSFYKPFDQATASPRGAGGGDHRNPFQIDRDRIVHSAALRRLQGKTQVFYAFLAGGFDFYRSRLTHSLEVAQIGCSICKWLEQESPHLKEEGCIDADLVEAICLAHDLGHPPFGHTGERALHSLMAEYGGFEGNAQTLRLLTCTLFQESRNGMNPTRALLDGILKYKTLKEEWPDASHHYLYDEQASHLGFVTDNLPFPEDLPAGKVRNQFRSLECQIMDWADDTAYSINDLADAVQAGFITAASLEKWAGNQKNLGADEVTHVEFLLTAIRDQRVESRLGRAIGEHVRACSVTVRENFLDGLTNRYRFSLTVEPSVVRKAKLNKRIATDLVFNTPQLHQLDFKAQGVLQQLFAALRDRYIERTSNSHRLHLLPVETGNFIESQESPRERARLVCDWLADLTDRGALRMHQRLFDTSMGGLDHML